MVTTTFANLQDGFQFLSLFDQAFAQCMPGATFDKAASYTLSSSDNGQTIALGGGALNTLTVGAANGFPSAFAVRIINKDSARGKVIAINGITSFILWPLQTVLLFNDNGIWQLAPKVQPWVIPAGTQFNVDNVNGVDSATNDGLGTGAGAFLTVQNTFAVIQKQTAQIGAGVNIQLPTITSAPITEQLAISGAMPPGISTITILGNPTTPTNCQWQLGSNQTNSISDYQSVTFNGIGFSSSGTGATFVSGSQFVIADFFNCNFGANSLGLVAAVNTGSKVNFLPGCSISGTATTVGLVQASQGASASLQSPIAINSNVNYGNFITSISNAVVSVSGLSFTGAGALSGTQFVAESGGVVTGDSGVSWPVGMSAGTATLGGLSDGATTTLNELTVPTIQAPVSTNLTISGSSGDTILFGIGTTTYVAVGANGNFRPVTDNTVPLGLSSLRWSAIFGVNLTISGSHTSTAWTTSGIRYTNPAVAYTDTSSSGTVTVAYTDLFGAGTINASTTTTYSSYYGSYFQAPVAGTNVTITNGYALGADSIGATTATIATATMTVATVANMIGSTSILITGQGGVGYAAGSGGAVTQTSNKATAVSLNKISGEITMNNAALSAATIVSFAMTNTSIAATDIMALNHVSGGTPGSYGLNAQCAAGGATINVRNNTAGTLSEAIVLGYVVIKGAIT